jgi:tRNA dimethylallyltransferase
MRIIALFGPTGVGKTAVALALAELLRARGEDPVAVSADALQVYAGLEILTGVATAAEQARLEHRLVSFLALDATFSAGQYAQLAHAQIDELLAAGRRPIVVGGTGLYLRAALSELSLRPPPPEGVRERWIAELERDGSPALHATLRERAPSAAEGLDPNDRQRIVRALELLDVGETPHARALRGAAQAGELPGGPSQLWSAELRRATLLVGLTMEREALYAAIDARVEAMLAAGAREEVLRAQAAGVSATARKALGFDELLTGDIEAMKRRTRNYAKRQLTWMRKLAGVRVIDATGNDPLSVAREILEQTADLDSRA